MTIFEISLFHKRRGETLKWVEIEISEYIWRCYCGDINVFRDKYE